MKPAKPEITGLVITFNEADRIGECLRSMAPVCRQLVVVDAGSTDGTVEIAERAGAQVVVSSWAGFSQQRNKALELATQPWSLFLDADERLSPKLVREILTEFEDSRAANRRRAGRCAYDLPFRTHFLGKELRFGAPGREHHVRLFRTVSRFPERGVHERVAVGNSKIAKLSGHVVHVTARDFSHYERKLASYAQLFANERAAHGRRATIVLAWSRAWWYLLKNYLLRFGFLDGGPGYIYHRLHAEYVFGKYARLWEQGAPTLHALRSVGSAPP